jgi:DNA-binding beta-propeller fold protein YncE
MNDSVTERVAREDPAPGGVAGPEHEAMLARLRASIDESAPATMSRRHHRGPSHLPAALGAALVAAIVAAVAIVLSNGGHVRSPVQVEHRPVDEPVRLVPAGTVHVGVGPADLLFADGSVWVAGQGFIARLNPIDGHEQARIPVPAKVIGPAQLAAGEGSIWVAYQGQGQVERIDPRADRVIATIGLRGGASGGGIAVAGGHVWASIVSQGRRGHVLVIDPRIDRVSGPPAAVGSGPRRLHAGLGSVWVQNTSDPNATASRIDPATRAVQQLSITGDPTVGLGYVWALGSRFGRGPTTLYRYAPRARPAYMPGAPSPRGVAITFGAGQVWVLSYPRSRSTRTFHPIRGTAAVTPVAPRPYRYGLPVGPPTRLDALQPDAIAVAGRDLWVADYANGELTHFRIER